MNVLVVTGHRSWEVIEPLEAVDASVSIVTIDSAGSLPHRFTTTLRQVRDTLKSEPIDVVLLDVYEAPGLAAWIAAKRSRTPILVRLVGDRTGDVVRDLYERGKEAGRYSSLVSYKLMNAVSRLIIGDSNGAIVVSTELKQRFCERDLFSETDIDVVPVPFRPNQFDANRSAPSQYEHDGPMILTVTNLSYKRKFDGVRDALAQIQGVLRDRPDAQYVIAGGGWYEARLRQYVEQNVPDDISDRVVITGFVDNVQHLHAAADVFVYISYLDGYPNAVLEAQGMGLPVVANEALGMVDQIDHGETGLLVDPTDDERIATATTELLENDERRTRIQQNARRRIVERNSVEAIGSQLVEAIESVHSSSAPKL